MTDRELLKLAAEAIGEKCDQLGANAFGLYKPKEGYMQPYIEWNPLTDDGDALRLALKLNMNLDVVDGYSGAQVLDVVWCSEPHHGNPLAATRRAITRAAAEIGKAKCV
jgi:hypothetical protein